MDAVDALILIEALLIVIAVATYEVVRFISPLLYDIHHVAEDNKSTSIHELATIEEEGPCSSSFSREWTYDVFLNFRGKDTRFDFTRNLYEALRRKGIHTFMDDEGLKRGREIVPSLLKAIQESRMGITIFSRNYASSAYCLDELVQILECIKKEGRLVLPIFYDVDPSVVRHQRENYREAFAKHERRFKNDEEKVKKWRQALHDAANLSGLYFTPGFKYESCMIEEIVNEVSGRINRTPLHIIKYPVGLESRVQQVKPLLDVGSNEGVQMVGLCGIGGIGKTTIARAIYDSIADSFEGICFLANVRENSINNRYEHLQEMLLSKIVEEDIKIVDVHEGIPIIKHRLHQKKVLLVLDDVDKLKQMEALAGGLDWFGSGSRIIITTRDKHLLELQGVERIYEVEFLNEEEALELLRWNAFRQNRFDPSYMENLNNVVNYACGLPLALEVIGSNLFNRGVDDWSSALEAYKKIPIKEVQQILKVSYDALDEHQQEIFLDIACCFKGDTLEYVKCALYARDISPDNNIKVLIDKCLIKIDSGHVTMHELIQDMAREIVRQQSLKEPGERTRLCSYKDILLVLKENKGTKKIEAINLDLPGDKEVDWSGEAFKNMPNLKILIIRNARFSTGPKYLPNSLRVLDWEGYPYPCLPYDFYPKELVILRMPTSCFNLVEKLKNFQSLSVMDFSECVFLRRVPNLSGVPNLKELYLEYCSNLIEVHPSIGFLNKLKRLSLTHCRKLKTFPSIWLTSLEYLSLSDCHSLQRFPEILGMMEHIRDIYLQRSSIEELPLSFRNLIGLQNLKLDYCYSLREVRGIPPNLIELSATKWTFLSRESRSILLSQALHEVGNLKFRIRGDMTPKWLDHYTAGCSVSFWIRKKFPNMVVCFVAKIGAGWSKVCKRGTNFLRIIVQINLKGIGFRYMEIIDTHVMSKYTFLYDLQRLIPKGKLESLVLEAEWNRVEISCSLNLYNGRCSIPKTKWIGIYVYKQKSRMEDIRFTNPDEESHLEFLKGLDLNSSPSELEQEEEEEEELVITLWLDRQIRVRL